MKSPRRHLRTNRITPIHTNLSRLHRQDDRISPATLGVDLKPKYEGTNDLNTDYLKLFNSKFCPVKDQYIKNEERRQLHTNRITHIYTAVSRLRKHDDKISTAMKAYRRMNSYPLICSIFFGKWDSKFREIENILSHLGLNMGACPLRPLGIDDHTPHGCHNLV